MLFGWFKKKIKVSEGELGNSICYLYPKNKTKKLKINTELIVPENTYCLFAINGQVFEVFKEAGEYELNGNSLPKLFKAGKFNVPNKNGKISPFFKCQIFFLPKKTNYLNCEIKKFKFKDEEFGRQKATFKFEVVFDVSEPKEFLQVVLNNSRNLSNKSMQKSVEKVFLKTLKKWVSKHKFTLSDVIQYTKGFNEELTKLLAKKYELQGILVREVKVTDVLLREELMQELRYSNKVTSKIQKKLKKQDFTISIDGVEIEKKMQMNSRYKIGSLQEKYANEASGMTVQKDNSEYTVTTLAGNRDEYGNEIKEAQKTTGKYCLTCGKLIPTDSTYCPYCANICE